MSRAVYWEEVGVELISKYALTNGFHENDRMLAVAVTFPPGTAVHTSFALTDKLTAEEWERVVQTYTAERVKEEM